MTVSFNAPTYFAKLRAASLREELVKVQGGAFREFSASQEEKTRNESATKGDSLEMELRLQKGITQTKMKIETAKHEALKLLIGLFPSQSAFLAAVFA